jgi:hypothetical protein
MQNPLSFRALLMRAIRELKLDGFRDLASLDGWLRRLRYAAAADLPTQEQIDTQIQSAMRQALRRAVSPTAVRMRHPGIALSTVDRLKPRFQAELTQRIVVSASLIKLNREQMIERMLSRFSGWATSIPAGGSKAGNDSDIIKPIAEPIRQARYEVRRVQIDQGHKLIASINAVIAEQSNAIAAMWRSHGKHDKSYDARPEHLARDGRFWAIRGNWAIAAGLMNKGEGYADEIDEPAVAINCRCWWLYVRHLRDLPESMLTAKGRFAEEEKRVA